jgi:hypothetical protein
MKQTTVEWLQEAFEHSILTQEQVRQTIGLFEQAKDMEKEQIVNAFTAHNSALRSQQAAEEYYNETYNRKFTSVVEYVKAMFELYDWRLTKQCTVDWSDLDEIFESAKALEEELLEKEYDRGYNEAWETTTTDEDIPAEELDLIIDPPSGWKYGFPKPIPKDRQKDVKVWLVENGYPQEEIDAYGESLSCRYWEAPKGKLY